MKPWTILDIETYGLPEAVALLPEPVAPEHYKDPVKIAAYIADAKVKRLERAALDPDCCRIVALGWHSLAEEPRSLIAQDDDREQWALVEFWTRVWSHCLIGFCSFGFDLPVLLRRSLYLGVRVPVVSLDRYRSPHVDLYERLTFNGRIPGHTLKFYAQRLGIAVPDITAGKDVAALVSTGQWDQVQAHNLADLALTRTVADRLGVFGDADTSYEL